MLLDTKNFGEQVRSLRRQQGLTLTELAEKTQRSASLLSQIENGNVSPSFNTMQSVAEALDIHLGQMTFTEKVSQESDCYLMNASARKILITQEGVRHQLLSHGLSTPFEFILIEIPPGTSTGDDLYDHEGEECALLLEGELLLEVNGQIQRLEPGDSITLKSTTPHKLVNPGETKAVAIWVNSVPYFFSTK